MSDETLSRWDGSGVRALARAWRVPRVEAHARIGSTNDRARELARVGAPPWSVVVADEQTRGRGRRGRKWVSARGAGLWMSVLLGPSEGAFDVDESRRAAGAGPTIPSNPPESPRASRVLPLAAGLACAEAIESVAPGLDVGIKWPNDLIVGGRKVGGILCEAADGRAVVGVGINVTDVPAVGGAPLAMHPTALEVEAGNALSRSLLAGAVIAELRRRLPEGMDAGSLAARDVLAGRTVDTEQEGPGRARGIAPDGALLLERADGARVRVVSGSVRLSSESAGEGVDRQPGGCRP